MQRYMPAAVDCKYLLWTPTPPKAELPRSGNGIFGRGRSRLANPVRALIDPVPT